MHDADKACVGGKHLGKPVDVDGSVPFERRIPDFGVKKLCSGVDRLKYGRMLDCGRNDRLLAVNASKRTENGGVVRFRTAGCINDFRRSGAEQRRGKSPRLSYRLLNRKSSPVRGGGVVIIPRHCGTGAFRRFGKRLCCRTVIEIDHFQSFRFILFSLLYLYYSERSFFVTIYTTSA